jgi:hypothetical protein
VILAIRPPARYLRWGHLMLRFHSNASLVFAAYPSDNSPMRGELFAPFRIGMAPRS